MRALRADPLDDRTSRLLQWYFHSGTDTEDGQIVATFEQIAAQLAATRSGGLVTCVDSATASSTNPCRRVSASAYADDPSGSYAPGSTGFERVAVCRPAYFQGPRRRAELMIHECGHLVGLSVNGPRDVYQQSHNFRYLSAPSARTNTDTYAFFASSVSQGAGPTFVVGIGTGLGAALAGGTEPRLYSRFYGLSLAIEHPDLLTASPFLGLDLITVQVPELGGDVMVLAPQLGVSFDLARDELRGRVGIQGGPTFDLHDGSVGAQAAAEGGVRWRFVEIAAEVGYLYNPRASGAAQHALLLGANARIDLNELFATLVTLARGHD